ncbi:MAG: glutamate formimidoyltransferase [Candidatus Latescibacterota bacterium]|nr:MAG: glutamate formimidoyltransferase [Candidatus Latescibacterota bacterium]
MKLVECVPNFSEGSDGAILDAISAAIAAVEGVRLLDVDPGEATNRTVFTFVGPPDAAQEAAFQAIRVAAERIDMRSHRGEHARLGATDVCPFVPLQGTSMEECVTLARALGQRVGDELEIPVYLYEEAAKDPQRRNLATIRAGEYEGLEAKLRDPEWKPDFGPTRFNARAGATVIGAREFLVAYNINLNTRDKKLATDIALDLREAGRNKRGPDGKFVRDDNGVPIKKPGRFKHVKAVGWYIEEYARAQISINFTNIRITPVHEVFDAACEEATKRGLRVTGSELVGLIPREAMLAAGRHYLRKQRRSSGVPESELIHIAVRSLGLDELAPFDAEEKIIEDRVRDAAAWRLRDLRLCRFVDELSTDSATPGGGSVAALCGALGAALTAMVANLTHNPRKTELPLDELQTIAEEAQSLQTQLTAAVDADTAAFDAVLAAMRMPRQGDEEIAARAAAMRAATRHATRVPLGVVERACRGAQLARQVAEIGNPASLSDAGVAALCAATAAEGAYYNVLINLAGLDDPEDADFVRSTRDAAQRLLRETEAQVQETRDAVRQRLENPESSGD